MTYVSPSQIATWRGCSRKWAYSRQRPRTQNKWAAFGTKMHAELEGWLRNQTPPDNTTLEGRTAMAGLRFLPMPGTCDVEQRLDITYENVHYIGYIDARWYDPKTRCANVVDHKSCGSFDYCHTPETLEDDPQYLVYGMAGIVEYPDAIMVRGLWNYLRRATPGKPGKANPVELIMSAYHLRERFIEMHRKDGVAIAASAGKRPEEFPREGADNGECDRYGGCPFAKECWAGIDKPVNVAAILSADKGAA